MNEPRSPLLRARCYKSPARCGQRSIVTGAVPRREPRGLGPGSGQLRSRQEVRHRQGRLPGKQGRRPVRGRKAAGGSSGAPPHRPLHLPAPVVSGGETNRGVGGTHIELCGGRGRRGAAWRSPTCGAGRRGRRGRGAGGRRPPPSRPLPSAALSNKGSRAAIIAAATLLRAARKRVRRAPGRPPGARPRAQGGGEREAGAKAKGLRPLRGTGKEISPAAIPLPIPMPLTRLSSLRRGSPAPAILMPTARAARRGEEAMRGPAAGAAPPETPSRVGEERRRQRRRDRGSLEAAAARKKLLRRDRRAQRAGFIPVRC